MIDEDEQEFKAAVECHICGQKYGNKMFVLGTIAISLDSTGDLLIKIATSNSGLTQRSLRFL